VFTELSAVTWDLVFQPGIYFPWPFGFVRTAVCFALWALFTTVILVLMEGLSAFLHTLRLHW